MPELHGPIVVTGAAGGAGRAILRDLSQRGVPLIAVDLDVTPDTYDGETLSSADSAISRLRADLTDLGQTLEVLRGASAVVHMANIPAPGLRPAGVTFADNMRMNWNVFTAAHQLGLERVVWASSETTLGLPFDEPPRYAPVDEAHYPVPESSYALSKVASETVAEHVSRWSGIPFIGLRFSNILGPAVYRTFPDTCWHDVHARKWNLWGYVDARDVAQSVYRALVADVAGARAYVIAATDTVMPRPSRELMAEVFPGVPVADDLPEYGTLLSIDRARAELGYVPAHSWRDVVAPDAD